MRNKKKKNLFTTLSMCFLLTLGSPLHVNATVTTDYNDDIIIQYVNIGNVTSNLSISGKTAHCKGSARSQNGQKCNLTVTLQRNSDKGWVNVKSWSTSAKSKCSIDKYYTLSKKGSYRVKTVGICENESNTSYSKVISY